MKSISYQEKLSRQFTGYAAGMVTVFFAVFTMILLIYTLGINGYRNEKYNRLLSDSFTDTYDRYAEFLLSPGAAEQFSRRLSGEISDNFLSYYYNSFNLSAGMQSGLILSDASGGIVYCGVDDGYRGATCATSITWCRTTWPESPGSTARSTPCTGIPADMCCPRPSSRRTAAWRGPRPSISMAPSGRS